MSERFLDREELQRLQQQAEEEHGHPFAYALRRHFFGSVPVFLVDDIDATCEYYERVLGFQTGFTHGDPPYFACVSRNNALINLNKADPGGTQSSSRKSGADAYLLVSQLDEVYEEMRRYGATIVSEPRTFDYGMREFQIEDCNGFRLTLAEGTMSPDRPGRSQ
jgi:predicted enzyme related to lactoylglutathione lyase